MRKEKIKLKGLNHSQTLEKIKDERLSGLNYVQIAEKLGLSSEAVFRAHLILMKNKQLAWKPEQREHQVEQDGKIETSYEIIAVWFAPTTITKQSRFSFPKIKLNKNRDQTKNKTKVAGEIAKP